MIQAWHGLVGIFVAWRRRLAAAEKVFPSFQAISVEVKLLNNCVKCFWSKVCYQGFDRLFLCIKILGEEF